MQFSKLFGVTLIAMASFGQAQIVFDPLDFDPPVPTPPSGVCTVFRRYSGYIPRLSPQSDNYWVNDQVQGAFETIMASESCPAVANGKTAWDSGSISTYLKSIPTQTLPPSNELKEYTKYYKKASDGTDNENFHIDWVDAAFNCASTAGFAGPSAAFDPDFNAAYCGGDGDFTNLPTGYAVGAAGGPGTEVVAGKECVGIEESVKKATSYVFQFVEVVQLLEAAIRLVKQSGCNFQRDENLGNTPCEDAVELWDAAAAIFTGSLEGEAGALPGGGSPRVSGKTFYTLGEKRCRNFKTCGPEDGDLGAPSKDNTASINSKILQYFAAGSHAAYSGDNRRMEYFKRKISAKMMVPWTQGVFRYAYRLSSDTTDPTSREHKEIAELSTFAVGALPKLWACSEAANEKVAGLFRTGNNFGIGNEIDWLVIKLSFECNYRCLGITCEEVGGLYDVDLVYNDKGDLLNVTKPDAGACDDKINQSGAKEVANCVKPNKAYNKKCRGYNGPSGISGRTKPEYYVDKLD